MQFTLKLTGHTSIEFAAEYKGKYYKMASVDKLQIFLAEPEKFVPPSAKCTLPAANLLPHKISPAALKQTFPKQAELNGYCPVTYTDGHHRYDTHNCTAPLKTNHGTDLFAAMSFDASSFSCA